MSLYATALLLTALSLFVFVLGFRDIVEGSLQRRKLATRGSLAEVERRANSPMERMDTALRKTEIGRKIEERITRAGVRLRVSTFVLLLSAAAIIAVVFVWQSLAPILGLLAAVGVGAGFFAYLKRQEERRREIFTTQLPEIARVLSNATQAGLALPTAVDMAADELADPAGSELRIAARAMQLGQPFEEAIADLRDRMPSREIGVLISTLLVASRSGGALVTALRNISDTLESRKETRREVKTILGETTATAWALLSMGVGALFLINFMQPGTVRTMTQSLAGNSILFIGLGLFVIGFVGVRRLTKIDF